MGSVFYQIWKLADKKSRKLIVLFLAIDVIVWNFIVVPMALTKGIVLPSVEVAHFVSILEAFGLKLTNG